MPTPILKTKLYVPLPPLRAASRPRLIETLNRGKHHKLTLISAPAGFGKTTLVSEWVAEARRPVAWLSLDEGDSVLTRFLTYLIAALQTLALSGVRMPNAVEGVTPNLGQGVLDALESSQPPSIEPILTALLNEIATIPDNPSTAFDYERRSGQGFILVLDDYHLVDARSVDDALTFLLEHMPPQMHLVITTREDPQLPLSRLRARGQLTELRAADLRFTPSEATEFLNSVMGLALSAQEISVLENRTEGWIAGLQLAVLSMQGHQDVSGFIRAFAGDHRYIVDYLIAEVLQHQPEPLRKFLLQTAILDRLNGSLCDAVTAQTESAARLEALERGNFFVVPLDDRRHWYRYHHLFAQVLYARLMAEQPDLVSTLHLRASEWYEQHGLASDAIRHAMAAEDFERAANLIERAVPDMSRNREEATLLGWLKALPDEVVRCRPVLSVRYAGVLLLGGELEGVEARLRDAELWLDTIQDLNKYPEALTIKTERESLQHAEDKLRRTMVVADKEEFRSLPGWIAIYRAAIALALGDVPNAVKHARLGLNLVPEDDHLMRGAAAGLLGLASWTSGDLEGAHRTFANGMAHLQSAGNISDAIGGSVALADIWIAQGRLRQAMHIYERGLQLAKEQGTPALRGTADMYVGMSELHREYDDLNAATEYLLRSKEQGEYTGFPRNAYRWRVAMARIRQARGDPDGALVLLQEAEPLYVSDFYPNVRPVAAIKTRVWVAQGRLSEAFDWVREQGLSVEEDLHYVREFEHITLARVLLAWHKSDRTERSLLEAMGLAERLLKAAEEGGRRGSVIEILVLQAQAHQMKGNTVAALTSLERALTLAEPEGYVRIFLDEGPPMAQLLGRVAARGFMPDYTAKLLAAFKAEQPQSSVQTPLPTASAAHSLVEPLTEREQEILRLFKTELSGPDIADELVIALSTLRTHTKSIYSKLNVNSRRSAVERASELNLI